jgi:hypothetical protein
MDERLRSIERRSKSVGGISDLVRLGREKLRAGRILPEDAPVLELLASERLSLEQLELAAYLGEPLALELLDHDAIRVATLVGDSPATNVVLRDSDVTMVDIGAWLPGLALFGPTLFPRALLVGAHVVLANVEPTIRTLPPARTDDDGEELNEREATLHAAAIYLGWMDQAQAHARAGRKWQVPYEQVPWIPGTFEGPFYVADATFSLAFQQGANANRADPLEEAARRWAFDVAQARANPRTVLEGIVRELRPW